MAAAAFTHVVEVSSDKTWKHGIQLVQLVTQKCRSTVREW